jgi:integrase
VGLEEHPQPRRPKTITVKAREDALERIGLHEARHTCASILIAAGVNAKALSVIMGTRRSPRRHGAFRRSREPDGQLDGQSGRRYVTITGSLPTNV